MSRVGPVELIDGPQAEHVDEAGSKAAVGHNPDRLLARLLAEGEFLLDDLIVAAQITEMDARVETELGQVWIQFGRHATDDAAAPFHDLGQDVHVPSIHLKGPQGLTVHLIVQPLKGP
jgi:hypothetical protein